MATVPVDSRDTLFDYAAFGGVRTARLRRPPETHRGTAVICTGSAMLGLDPARPAVAGLEALASSLEDALLAARFGVVRPEPIAHVSEPELLLEAASSLLEAAFTTSGSIGRHIVIALSAAAPLLSIAAAQRGLDAMILIAPPILEGCSGRPDRVNLPLQKHLGLSPDVAAALGAFAPMSKGSKAAPIALLVHGAADRVVPEGDSIGWRASLAAAGIQARRIEVAFAAHDLSPAPCRASAVEAIVAFLANES